MTTSFDGTTTRARRTRAASHPSVSVGVKTSSAWTGSFPAFERRTRETKVLPIAEAARIEDRNHFEALMPRIYELGGRLPGCMKEFHDLSACPPASLPKNASDAKAILKVLVEAERWQVVDRRALGQDTLLVVDRETCSPES